MDCHNTHFMTKTSKDENGYKYDHFGNIIVDSIDDLIYDKYIVKNENSSINKINNKIKNLIDKKNSPINSEKKNNKKSEKNEMNHKLSSLLDDNKSRNIIKLININKENQNIDISLNSKINEDKTINIKINIPKNENKKSNEKNINIYENDNIYNKDNINNINNLNEDNGSSFNDKFLISKIIDNENKENSKDKNKDKNNKKSNEDNLKEISFNGKQKNNVKDFFKNKKNQENLLNLKHKLNDKNRINNDNINNNKYNENKKIKKINFLNNNKNENKNDFDKSFNMKKRYNKSMIISNFYEKDLNNNNNIEMNNKSLILKLKLNSNNTSIESINIENEEKRIKKLKKEYIFVKPILTNCFFTKIINNSIKLINTAVKNKIYFCTKENYVSHQIILGQKYPINLNRIKSKKHNNNYKKLKINPKNKSLPKKCALTPLTKFRKKNIDLNSQKRKKNISNKNIGKKDDIEKKLLNQCKINTNKKMIKNNFVKIPKLKKTKLNNSFLYLSNNNKNKEIPIFKISDTLGDVTKKENTFLYKDENNLNYHMKEYIKHKGKIENCPLCLEMTKKSEYNKNKIMNNNNNDKLNKKLMDYCRKEEINKLKIININNRKIIERNNSFRDYSKTNKAKNNIQIKKSFNSFNKNKNELKRKTNLMDYFSNNDSSILHNYTHLINIEFPAINSYFHKRNKK